VRSVEQILAELRKNKPTRQLRATTLRFPADLLTRFQAMCKELGVPMSRFIVYWMDEALRQHEAKET
jgi:hypothetical protein